MGRIQDLGKYPKDTVITSGDYLIGTNIDNNAKTQNYSVNSLAEYISNYILNGGTTPMVQNNKVVEVELYSDISGMAVEQLVFVINDSNNFTVEEDEIFVFTIHLAESTQINKFIFKSGKGSYGLDNVLVSATDFIEISESGNDVTNTSGLTNDGANGTDPFITENDVPEYDLSLNANVLTLFKDGAPKATEDLSLYLDDTNLARIVNGTLNAATGIATFTRDDSSTFTLDLSNLSSKTTFSDKDGNAQYESNEDKRTGYYDVTNEIYYPDAFHFKTTPLDTGVIKVVPKDAIYSTFSSGSSGGVSNTPYINIKLPVAKRGDVHMEVDFSENRNLTGFGSCRFLIKGEITDTGTTGWIRASITILTSQGRRPSNLGDFEENFDFIFGKKDGVPCVSFRNKMTPQGAQTGYSFLNVNSFGFRPYVTTASTPDDWIYGWETELIAVGNIGLVVSVDDLKYLDNSYSLPLAAPRNILIDDLGDAQSDTTNVMLGSKEEPDSVGETRGIRNVVIGKEVISDGLGDENVIIGHGAFNGLGSNGNNNSDNNVIIGNRAADDRVNSDDNVIIGGNSVQGDGSGSRNIVIGANVDIGGHGINDKLNIGESIIGELDTKKLGVNGVDPEEDLHSKGSIRQETTENKATMNLGIAEYYDSSNFSGVQYRIKLPYVFQSSAPYNADGGQSRWDVRVHGSSNGAHTAIDLRFMGFLFSPNGISNESETIEHNNPAAGEGVTSIGSLIDPVDNKVVLYFTLSGSNLTRFRVDSMMAGQGEILSKGDVEITTVVPS